jgi:hypothetical protein
METKATVFNKRKHDRISTQYETLVYNDNFFGQLVDVSESGLAFAYSKDQSKVKDIFIDLNIFCNNKNIHIKNLRCRAVSDITAINYSLSGGQTMQRQGVQFNEISEEQNRQLQEILKLDINSLWLEQ